MSGYVASARIDRGSARLTRGWGQAAAHVGDDRPPSLAAAWIEAPPDELRPGRLAARWLGFRERWSQLTFYLFDPNSWR